MKLIFLRSKHASLDINSIHFNNSYIPLCFQCCDCDWHGSANSKIWRSVPLVTASTVWICLPPVVSVYGLSCCLCVCFPLAGCPGSHPVSIVWPGYSVGPVCRRWARRRCVCHFCRCYLWRVFAVSTRIREEHGFAVHWFRRSSLSRDSLILCNIRKQVGIRCWYSVL